MKSNNHANIVSVFVVPHTTYARSNFIFDGKIVMSLLNDFFCFPIFSQLFISATNSGFNLY